MRLWIALGATAVMAGAWTACITNRDEPGGYTTAATGGGFTTGPGLGPGSGGNQNLGGGLAVIEDPEAPCDASVAIDTEDPVQAAAAIGICKQAENDDDWGLVEAKWTMGNGAPIPTDALDSYHIGHGVLDDFGAEVDPLEGDKVLGLSSGTARNPDEPGYQDVSGYDKGYQGSFVTGLSYQSPACPGVVQTGQPHDIVALELRLRAPEGAQGIAFDFNFFTYEWPDFVCSQFNDYFAAMMTPSPNNELNISFDAEGNFITVNNALVEVCDCGNGPPCDAGMLTYECNEGASMLTGTGFEGDPSTFTHAATGWLSTQAPLAAGENIIVRFAVWDSGDGVLDSTAIVDNFRWLGFAEPDPETTPIPK